jgi:hypothetical protein
MQLFAHNFPFSMFFGMSTWILHDIVSEPLIRDGVGTVVFVMLVWMLVLLGVLNIIFKKYKLEGSNLIIPSKKFLQRYEHIDISKITSIEKYSEDEGEAIYTFFKVNMENGKSHEIDRNLENIALLFARMQEINEQLHFSFDVCRVKEWSFIRRCFNFGTIISFPIYTFGFYFLLARIMKNLVF